MAMLWAQKIMFGKKTYADVPAKLKEQVKEILIESGLEELAAQAAFSFSNKESEDKQNERAYHTEL